MILPEQMEGLSFWCPHLYWNLHDHRYLVVLNGQWVLLPAEMDDLPFWFPHVYWILLNCVLSGLRFLVYDATLRRSGLFTLLPDLDCILHKSLFLLGSNSSMVMLAADKKGLSFLLPHFDCILHDCFYLKVSYV